MIINLESIALILQQLRNDNFDGLSKINKELKTNYSKDEEIRLRHLLYGNIYDVEIGGFTFYKNKYDNFSACYIHGSYFKRPTIDEALKYLSKLEIPFHCIIDSIDEYNLTNEIIDKLYKAGLFYPYSEYRHPLFYILTSDVNMFPTLNYLLRKDYWSIDLKKDNLSIAESLFINMRKLTEKELVKEYEEMKKFLCRSYSTPQKIVEMTDKYSNRENDLNSLYYSLPICSGDKKILRLSIDPHLITDINNIVMNYL